MNLIFPREKGWNQIRIDSSSSKFRGSAQLEGVEAGCVGSVTYCTSPDDTRDAAMVSAINPTPSSRPVRRPYRSWYIVRAEEYVLKILPVSGRARLGRREYLLA